jgi:hypothetical protein
MHLKIILLSYFIKNQTLTGTLKNYNHLFTYIYKTAPLLFQSTNVYYWRYYKPLHCLCTLLKPSGNGSNASVLYAG